MNGIELLGKWRIEILTGNLPDMSGLGHIKIIKSQGRRLVGYNRTLWIPWGKFDIHTYHDYWEFVYRNGKFYDRVWKVNDRILEGEYRSLLPKGLPQIVGTFRMVRKNVL